MYLNLHETSIEKIGDGAFKNCTNLTTVVGISTSHQEQLQAILDDNGSTSMILPASLAEIGVYAFDECPKLKNSISNNWIHYECDVNRGGRQFLQRDHHHLENDDDGNDDGDTKGHGKVYYSSLWLLILYHVMHEMKLPKHSICRNDDDLVLYSDADPLQRRASVVFYLLVHGVVADLQPQHTVWKRTSNTNTSSSINKFLFGLVKEKEWRIATDHLNFTRKHHALGVRLTI